MRCQLNNKGATIMIHAHQTAPTQFVDAAGIRFAYRRFGRSGGVPLGLFMHFTGTMDHWDPLGTDGLARSGEHTSELPSRPHLVCRLLPGKKNNQYYDCA